MFMVVLCNGLCSLSIALYLHCRLLTEFYINIRLVLINDGKKNNSDNNALTSMFQSVVLWRFVFEINKPVSILAQIPFLFCKTFASAPTERPCFHVLCIFREHIPNQAWKIKKEAFSPKLLNSALLYCVCAAHVCLKLHPWLFFYHLVCSSISKTFDIKKFF